MHEQPGENSSYFKLENNIPLLYELPNDIDQESKEKAYRLLYQQAEKYRSLPETAKSLAGALEWPIDPMDKDVVIACPFNSLNYVDSKFGTAHEAVDIQGSIGEKVYAPARMRIVEFSIDPRTLDSKEQPTEESLGDISFIVEEPHVEEHLLTGVIAHIRLADIPLSLKQNGKFFDMKSNIIIERGEQIGSIGNFAFQLKGEQRIPPKIKEKFGNAYNHIHIAYRIFPRKQTDEISHWALHVNHVAEKFGGESVDPILLGRLTR